MELSARPHLRTPHAIVIKMIPVSAVVKNGANHYRVYKGAHIMKIKIALVCFLVISPEFIYAENNDNNIILKMMDGWSSYEKEVDAIHLQGWNIKLTSRRDFTRQGKTSEYKSVDLFQNNGNGSVLIEKEDSVQCGNEIYTFFLQNKRSSIDTEDNWMLKSASLGGKQKHQYKGSRTLGADLYQYSKMQTLHRGLNFISLMHLRYYFSRPHFSIRKIERVTEGGSQFLILEFASPHESASPSESPEAQRDGLQSGTIKFEEGGFFLPQSYSVELQDGQGSRMRCTGNFQYNSTSVPLLIRHETKSASVGGDNPWTEIGEYKLDYYSPLDRADSIRFSLTHYGLPEPQGVNWSKPTPFYPWFGLATALFTGGFILFRSLKQRSISPIAV